MDVALKQSYRQMMISSELEDIDTEFQALSKLDHKGVVKMHGIAELNDAIYLVMEYCPIQIESYLEADVPDVTPDVDAEEQDQDTQSDTASQSRLMTRRKKKVRRSVDVAFAAVPCQKLVNTPSGVPQSTETHTHTHTHTHAHTHFHGCPPTPTATPETKHKHDVDPVSEGSAHLTGRRSGDGVPAQQGLCAPGLEAKQHHYDRGPSGQAVRFWSIETV